MRHLIFSSISFLIGVFIINVLFKDIEIIGNEKGFLVTSRLIGGISFLLVYLNLDVRKKNNK